MYLKELEPELREPEPGEEVDAHTSQKRRGGFVIYTVHSAPSLHSLPHKSRDLSTNPWASLTFWWKPVERQVRVEGRMQKVSQAQTQRYFDTRVRGSRIGAWSSLQSEVLYPNSTADRTREPGAINVKDVETAPDEDDGRAGLEARVRENEERFKDTDQIPVPPFWGGLRLIPERLEFWQGRETRLHDRFRYERVAKQGVEDEVDGWEWRIERLSP